MNALAPYRRVLANSRLTRLLAGEFISSVGDWLYLVALLVVVYETSRDPVALGLVGAGRIVPFLVLAVPAGMVADRFDRRRIMIATDVVRAVLQLVLAGFVIVGAPPLAIVIVAIVAACASAFFGPAIGSYLPSLVDDEADLGPANSVWATLDNLAFFVGPAVAGILIGLGGLALAFLLNAVSFAFVALVLMTLPSRGPGTADVATGPDDPGAAPPSGPPGRPGAAGWGSIARRLPGIIALDAATTFVGAGLAVLTVVIAYEALGSGEEVTGYLNAATGIGGIIAGFVAGWLVLRRLDLPVLAASVVGAAAMVALASSTEVPPALVAIAVASGALLVLEVVIVTLLQRSVADAERGRAMGVLQVSSSTAMIAGAFVAPLAAAQLGVSTALIASGVGGALVAAASVALLRPAGALDPPKVSDRRIELLRGSPFGALPPARLEAAAVAMAPLDVSAGTRVVEQGAQADRFYLIDRGRFRVTQREASGSVAELRVLGPGDVFGEIGLLTSGERTATVTADTHGRLYALDRDAFLDLVSAGPGLSTRLLDLHRGAAAPGRA